MQKTRINEKQLRKIIFNHPINKKSVAISAKIPNEINELRTQITNLNA